MQSTTRKNLARLSLAPCLLFSVLSPAIAQNNSQLPLPPKVLVIMREYLKPGKTGSMHTKTESLYVNAMAAAKWPVHYFGMDSMSGATRSLFFTGYESFEAWEKDGAATEKNATLSAAVERAYAADRDLVSSYDSGTFAFREDLSLNPKIDIIHMRFFEISQFVVKPGHTQEFEEIAKMYAGAYAKMTPENHWAVFESMYGANNGGVFLVISPYKSLSEVDQGLCQLQAIRRHTGRERHE